MTIKLIWKHTDCSIILGHVLLQAAPANHPPFACTTKVIEQDTHLLLGEQNALNDPGKPAWYLANTLENEPTWQQGDVVAKGRHLMAVIHDIEQLPTCTAESIMTAWKNIRQTIADKQIVTIALPLLGNIHGKLTVDAAFELLASSLTQPLPDCLKKIWLIIPDTFDCQCLARLAVHP